MKEAEKIEVYSCKVFYYRKDEGATLEAKEILSTMLTNGGAIVENGNFVIRVTLYETRSHVGSDRIGTAMVDLERKSRLSPRRLGAIDFAIFRSRSVLQNGCSDVCSCEPDQRVKGMTISSS